MLLHKHSFGHIHVYAWQILHSSHEYTISFHRASLLYVYICMLIGSPLCSLHFQRDCFIDLSVLSLSHSLHAHTPRPPSVFLPLSSLSIFPGIITSLYLSSRALLLFPFLSSLRMSTTHPSHPLLPLYFQSLLPFSLPTSPFLPPSRCSPNRKRLFSITT